MSFNTALSGLNAASTDLSVTGNNIANSSTVGFKASRAEFADVYASSLIGTGSSRVGSGVKIANVAQQFDQGTISFTDNNLDLAIDGQGFFVTSDNGSLGYTRAGAFGVDDSGFIVTNGGARVQGFTANSNGTLSGLQGDLQLTVPNLSPKPTGLVEVQVNLDARSQVLSQSGTRLQSTGASIGTAQLGLPTASSTVLETAGAPTPFDFSINTQSAINAGAAIVPFNFTGGPSTFEVSLSGSSVGSENQTVTITLQDNINTLQDLISDIRDDLAGSGIGLDVRENPDNLGRLQFFALNSGEATTIVIDPNDNASFGAGVTRANVEAALGGIALGQGGAGASSIDPDPYGGTLTTARTGNLTAASFDLTVQNSSGNNGTVTVTLDDNITSATSLIADIRDDVLASGLSVDVRVDPDNPGRVQFFSTIPGENSTISVSNIDASNIGVTEGDVVLALFLETGVSIPGTPAASNGYPEQTVEVVYPDGPQLVTIPEGSSAAEIASIFSSPGIPGVTATASTTARVTASGFTNTSGTLQFRLNGVDVAGQNLQELANSINAGLPGIATVSATIDTNGDLVLNDVVGSDLVFGISGDVTDSIEVLGPQGLETTLDTSGTAVAVVGGSVRIAMEEDITLGNATPAVTGIFGVLEPNAFEEFELNTFDPTNQETYNAATSLNVFDSLGNPHTLSLYFVKERYTPGVAGEEANRWTMYTLVDGEDVGDPDLDLPPPQNTVPTRAAYNVQFNEDGTLNLASSSILVSNWEPLDADGNRNGAQGAQNVLAGGALPIQDPPTSSNFEIRLANSTQFGSSFSVNNLDQDGNSTGELSGIQIGESGIVSARFSNGKSQTLGQIALATFTNPQGLRAIGDTSWVETSESGNPIIAAPGTGSFGLVTSGALEQSNVDLSEQLVNLIIAQRNFQANARTISTSDEITQTIINL